MNRTKTILALALSLTLLTAGCLGILGGDEDVDATNTNDTQGIDISTGTQEDIQKRTATKLSNYTLSAQDALPSETVYFNGSVSAQANTAYESKNDRSGNDVNTYLQTYDVSQQIPEGQPTEMVVKLVYFGSAGSSADLDIYVNVPGTETEYASDNSDEWNWKAAILTKTVNTVGVQGEDHLVGVQVTNGKVVQPMDYTLKVTFRYADDVLTPYHPYAFEVPENATSIILESVKTGGDEHIKSDFFILGPDDELVKYTRYNDLAIASESVLIPVNQPGTYVFYAPTMTGGFLSLEADAPPEDRNLTILPRKLTEVTDLSGPAAGTPEYDATEGCSMAFVGSCETGTSTPKQGGQSATFTVADAFPLEIWGWVEGSGATAGTDLTISSSKGPVYEYKRVVRADQGDNSVGLTRDEITTNHGFGNLTKGEYTIEIVNDGAQTVGHTILTYERQG